MSAIKLDRAAVRRYLLGSQSLLEWSFPKKTKLPSLETVESLIDKLECVQLDPVSVVERNQHLVLGARIPGYKPEQLHTLLEHGHIFEYWANAMCAIPVKDYPIFKPIRELRYNHLKKDLETMKDIVGSVLTRLENDGPLPSRVFKSDAKVHGYWDNLAPKTKETSHALNLLLDAGLIRVVKREANERYFGITELTLPKATLEDAKQIETAAAVEALIDKYIRAYRVVDPRDARFGWLKLSAKDRQAEVEKRVKKGALIPIEIDGVKQSYYILAEDIDLVITFSLKEAKPIKNTLNFLPPLDNLLWSRQRIQTFFDFDYKWEIYTPQAKRLYGPYAMPILYRDQLIGRMDPILDRKTNQLIIRLLHFEPETRWTGVLKKSLDKSINAFAQFHGVKDAVIQKIEPGNYIIDKTAD